MVSQLPFYILANFKQTNMFVYGVYRAETSNHILQYLWDVVTCLCPWNLFLAKKLLIYILMMLASKYIIIMGISYAFYLW